jgi:hypothetical protein
MSPASGRWFVKCELLNNSRASQAFEKEKRLESASARCKNLTLY